MSVRRATARRTTLEKRRGEVIAAIVAGEMSTTALAKHFAVARSSVAKFIKRHAEEIGAETTMVARQAADFAIYSRVNRVQLLQELVDMSMAELRTNGITIVEERETVENGKSVIYRTRDYRASAVREVRGLIAQAQNEAGEHTKPAEINLLNAPGARVIITTPEAPLGF